MPTIRHRHRAAFTLLESLIVLMIIGILAGMLIPSMNPNLFAQLQAAASILGNDLDYARNLAVVNADSYKITFDIAANRWVLKHSGANTALDPLPISPFHRPSDLPNEQTVDLASLPSVSGAVRLWAVWELSNTPQVVGDLEFSALGSTTRAVPTMIWLAAGSGTQTRYISVRVNPVTGLYWVENFQADAPNPGAFAGS